MLDALLDRVSRWWHGYPPRPRTKAEVIAAIRAHFAAMGLPLDDLTDEEIEAEHACLLQLLPFSGATMDPARRAFRRQERPGGRPDAPRE